MGRNVKKKIGAPRERDWNGPVWLSLGFRPFFLLGPIFAVLAVVNWLFLLRGSGLVPAALSNTDWHIHEMLFGYSSAVIAGFLLTAVPNWTRRLPVVGWPLLWLVLVWIAGRVAMAQPFGGDIVMATIEMAFLPYLAVVVGREVIAGKNWRNLQVLLAISGMSAVNIWFHLLVLSGGDPEPAIRFGFAGILLLITLIGGRIIPSFTRNWLAQQQAGRMPVPSNKFDDLVLGFTAFGLFCWGLVGLERLLAPMFLGIGVLHLMRLWRWAGIRCFSNPLLLVLHVFYAFIPLGLMVLGLAHWSGDIAGKTAGLHLLGIGAIGGMTMAVSLRASLGHSGRLLKGDATMTVMMAFVGLSALLRAGGAIWPQYGWLVTASGLVFVAGFGLFIVKVGPWLLKPRLGA